MRRLLLPLLLLLPASVRPGVPEVVHAYAVPHAIAFGRAAQALAEAAEGTCDPAALDGPYQAAWDAWGPLADLRLGAAEALALSIAFWPDERGATPRALAALLAAQDPAALEPGAYAEQSVAARGLTALDHLLRGDLAADVADGGYACDLMRSATADLAAQAVALAEGWAAEGRALVVAGEPGNASYLSPDEAFRAVYTQALAGLEFTADSRLGRPLGEFGRPRPTRAEAWRSGRPLRQALASAEAAATLARLLVADGPDDVLAGPPLPATDAALDAVRRAAAAIVDPSFQDIADPTARLRVEILQQRVRALSDAIEAEVGAPLGIEPGFNSQDGD